MKRPAFQFYPADWRKDVELQSCSMAAQGLWINAMCVAHECEPYGHLTVNGKGMNAAQLGRQVGLSAKEAEALILELEEAGVVKRTPEGVLFSKRMVEDERVRNARASGGTAGADHGAKGAKSGIKGGRPPTDKGGFVDKTKGGLETPLLGFEEPPPSSSSSSSASTDTPQPPSGESMSFPGFDRFWAAWPKSIRKEARGKCLEAWRKARAEGVADEVLAHVETKKASEDWCKQGGQFIEAPLVYLNQRRWEGAEASEDLLNTGHVNSI